MSSPKIPAPTSDGGASAGLTELVGLLTGMGSVQEFLTELAQVAAAALAVSCGITMRRDGAVLTVASSDARASAADEAQYDRGEGPCLQALDTGQVVSVPDLLDEQRWDGYPAHALAHGIRSSLSVPMTSAQGTSGALNLYAAAPRVFDSSTTLARATAFAAQGSAVLTVALRQADQVQLTEQLREALGSRSVIDQAIGIIMGQQRCDAPAAFAVLRSASQGRNRKLRDIATDIVTSVSEPPPSPGS